MLTPYDLAQQARERAETQYNQRARDLLGQGDRAVYDQLPYDLDAARDLWLRGMCALDAAECVRKGMRQNG